jgi:hypothetical protein
MRTTQDKEKKAFAQELYMQGDFSIKRLAETVNVTDKTMSKWITDGDWATLKNMRSVSKRQLLNDAYTQLAAVNEKIRGQNNIPHKEDYDAKSILGKEIERLSGTSIAQQIEAFEAFTGWLAKNDPKAAKQFVELSMRFINSLER